jgi:hypothetical protein
MGNQNKKPVEPIAPLNTTPEEYKRVENAVDINILEIIHNINVMYTAKHCIHGFCVNHPDLWNRCDKCPKYKCIYIVQASPNITLALLSPRLVGIINNKYTFVVDPKPEIKLDEATIKHIKQLKPIVDKLIKFRNLYNARQIKNSKIDQCMDSLNKYIAQHQRDLQDIESVEQINSIMDEIKQPMNNVEGVEGATN